MARKGIVPEPVAVRTVAKTAAVTSDSSVAVFAAGKVAVCRFSVKLVEPMAAGGSADVATGLPPSAADMFGTAAEYGPARAHIVKVGASGTLTLVSRLSSDEVPANRYVTGQIVYPLK